MNEIPRNKSDRPRLSIDISQEQATALKRYIPWGIQRLVFSALIDMLLKAFEVGGPEVLMSVLQKELDLPALLLKKER